MECANLPKPEFIRHLFANEGIFLRFVTMDGNRFAAVAVTGNGEAKPDSDRILGSAADLAVHMVRFGAGKGGPLLIVGTKNPQRANERTREAMLTTNSAALLPAGRARLSPLYANS